MEDIDTGNQELDLQLNRLREEIEALQRRAEVLEQGLGIEGIPNNSLLSQRFLTRAVAVFGYHLVGSLVIGIILGALYVLMLLLIRGLS